MKQRTIAQSVEFEGKGLHFNQTVRVQLHPAEPDTGLVLQFGEHLLALNSDNANPDNSVRRTVICNEMLSVNTTEHLMAAAAGLQIDNMRIIIIGDCDGMHLEMPLLDGSAASYAQMIMKAGMVEQEKDRDYFHYPYDFVFSTQKSHFAYMPIEQEKLILTTTIYFPHFLIGLQTFSIEIDENNFIKEIAPARTFCTLEEVEYLKKQGLIKGGTLREALVLGKDSYLNDQLHFNNEPVRHKLLDFLGDLRLLGKPLKGHFIANFGGHKSHIQFVKKLKSLENSYAKHR